MKLEEAQVLALSLCKVLEPYCWRVEVAGSIRRGKAEVGDIDIVAMPRIVDLPSGLFGCGIVKVVPSDVWKNLIPKALLKSGLKLEASGQELLRFSFLNPKLQVDIYRARPMTWGVILLVRTGSKEHNIKLCTLAKSKGLMLSASLGVIRWKSPPEPEKVIASSSEEKIFAALGLKFVEPKDREGPW